MKFKNQSLVNRFREFVSSVSRNDRIAVIHHTDPDGVCSGVIISKLIERLRKKKIDLRLNQKGNMHYIADSTLKKLRNKKINKVVITDLCVDEDPAGIKKLAEFAKILVIDHHPVYRRIKSWNIVLVKSCLVSDIPSHMYCAAKLSYDLSNLIVDMSEFDWIAAVGCIGDISADPFRPWLHGVFRKYGLKLKKDLFKTILGRVAILVSSAEAFDNRNAKLCYDIMYKARTYKDVLNSRLKQFRKRVDAELKYYLKNIRRLAKIYPSLDLVIYEVRPKYHTKSQLSTLLGIRYPKKTIFVVNVRKNPVSISARRGDFNVSVNLLLENAVKGIPGANTGGHIPSAGAVVPRKYYKKFKKRVIYLLGKR